MELVSCHNHTFYSGHGDGTVEELLCAAEACGISTIAVTEHYPLTAEFDPAGENALTYEQFPFYLSDLAAGALAHPKLEVVRGAEFDWLGSAEDRSITEADFEPFAYTLLSVHFLDGWGFDDPAQIDEWKSRGVDDVWRRYLEVWLDAVQSSWPATAMAHPDLVKKFGYYPSFDLQRYYAEMVESVKESGRMVELNVSGLFYPCAQEYPAAPLLHEFARAGIQCCIGPDAHTPANVDCGLKQGYKMLYEAGYRAITVPTADGDRRQLKFD